ncbi:hypothetical protein BE08_06060 [Sorangium cellulosum]|uniref:Molybdenum transport system permease n=1 Tax=Sorangium cellulosum TaxID=56 RepID=A0A150P2W3_SORCE|nr:hypothetical protein BE08_06060 [Sorangium cellulosum]
MMDWSPLLLSFKVSLLATALAAVVGVGLGALLATRRFVGRDLLDVALTLPMVMPPTVLGYYVLVGVGRNSFLGQVYEGVVGSPVVFSRTGVVIAATVGCLPLIVKSARAAIEGVGKTYLQAACTLGAGPLRRFFVIQLPLAAGGIMAGVMLGFARALGDFGVTIMVAGNIPGETQTAPLAIYEAIEASRDDRAMGMVLVLTAFALVTLYLVNRFSRRAYT